MPELSEENIKKILNLKGSNLIHDSIAERQLEVIRKGFNFLNQPENNALYIADEVGLGKTYIALGIASLMRHFSPNPESYQDVIIVPKENLQYKWYKEILQFIQYNYKQKDNRVKSAIGIPNGTINIHEKLTPIEKDIPGYHIYRNPTFSLGMQSSESLTKKTLDDLLTRIKNPASIEILKTSYEYQYFNKPLRAHLKRLYSYLLSIENPTIELLIVDEGHNYKYGLGDNDDDLVSDRNNVAARFFGLKKNSEIDKEIFEDFPDLPKMISPKVQKLIVLSATPKTESLLEIKKQFDCFTNKHVLSACKSDDNVKELLSSFLIRGKMNYELGGIKYSRNQCRHEHRKGNVQKIENPSHLNIEDNVQSLILGLLQYNTIKHLNAKNNATFELGMLAGFETFKIDNSKVATENTKEYEEVRSRNARSSQDYEILAKIIDSYRTEFNELPPHPKQDAIVKAAFELMQKGEKSLIFVRRVASAYEIERRLLDMWEKTVADQLNIISNSKLKSNELSDLILAYKDYMEDRLLNEKLESLFTIINERINANSKDYVLPLDLGIENTEFIRAGLYYAYNNYLNLPKGSEFKNLLKRQIHLSVVKSELVNTAYELVISNYKNWIHEVKIPDESNFEDEDEAYFFHSYFRGPLVKSFRKSRLYKENWFDVNYYLLNSYFKIAKYEMESLKNGVFKPKDINNIKEVQEAFLKYIKDGPYQKIDVSISEYPESLLKENTILTEVLCRIFDGEIKNFVDKLKRAGQNNQRIFNELKTLVTIVKSILRNGSGFLPIYIADKAKGDIIENYIELLTDESSIFHNTVKEIKTIINDYDLLRAVNFPESDSSREIELKLIYQSPVVGITGSKKNKSKVASQFRMPGFPFVLVTTDIFREGEDLHTYCQNIYHYGIAWNCSDMEQRTGRIDRINSMSNRRMTEVQKNSFEERVHVFYPYLEKTLEVNQVFKLFNSINRFTNAFDIVDSIKEDGQASTADKIEYIPQEITAFKRSRFEHDLFTGYMGNNTMLALNPLIGSTDLELKKVLLEFTELLKKSFEFYKSPDFEPEIFEIFGDVKLNSRDNRRGPFRIIIKNSIYPGKFILEIAGYLFKTDSRVRRLIGDIETKTNYKLIEVEEYSALAKEYMFDGVNIKEVIIELGILLNTADEIEFDIIKDDTNVFG